MLDRLVALRSELLSDDEYKVRVLDVLDRNEAPPLHEWIQTKVELASAKQELAETKLRLRRYERAAAG